MSDKDIPTDDAVFDQTNGLAEGLDGDSDGTAESDTTSEADRDDRVGLGEAINPNNK